MEGTFRSNRAMPSSAGRIGTGGRRILTPMAVVQSTRAPIELHIRSVPASSARAWLANATHTLDQLAANQSAAPFRLPPEMLARMRETVAALAPDPDRGEGDTGPAVLSFSAPELHDVVTYWFNITKLTAEQRRDLDIRFGVEEGAAFGDALAAAVGEAMVAHPDLAAFADRLAAEWDDCQPAFSAAAAAPGGRGGSPGPT